MSFSKDFIWGAASAAYQLEGAYNEDGKGLSIWDVYSRIPGNVQYTETGDIACDHYHRYKEDIELFKKTGIKYYRFSISWTRIIPDGTGKINEKGLKFYSDLVDELVKAGIEPMVTLFHWDYPYELYRQGGWMNDQSPVWFEDYIRVVVDALSDRVTYWMTINEPQCFIGCGYFNGAHAPFLKLANRDLIRMSHNVLLAHGRAVQYIRNHAKKKPIIGYAPTGPVYVPADNSEKSINEARSKSVSMKETTFFSTTWWSDPIFLGKYPEEAYEIFGEDMITPTEDEMRLISQPLDFYGANIYYSQSDKRANYYATNESIGIARTSMDWVVSEDVLYWAAKFWYERYKKPILITENGMAGCDWITIDGKVPDNNRIDFISRYVGRLMDAADEGIPVMGYIYWSIMDNYEWAYGYDKRFGLIYVDYNTQERVIKESGYWFKELIATNGDILR